jgi:hypothetical protein
MACSGISFVAGRLLVLGVAFIVLAVVGVLPLGLINLSVARANTQGSCDLNDSVFGVSLVDCLFYRAVLQILCSVLLALILLCGLVGLGVKGLEDTCTVGVAMLCFLLAGNIVCFLALELLSGVILLSDGWTCLTSASGVGIMSAINLCISFTAIFVCACLSIK